MKKDEKPLDLSDFLKRAAAYCARRETCQFDMYQKLKDWGAEYKVASQVVAELISQNFISEERYAKAFVHDKQKFRSWGPQKIKHALEAKKISAYSIQKALQALDSQDVQVTIQKLYDQKISKVQGKTLFIKQQKVFKYLLGKGYSWDDVQRVECIKNGDLISQ